MFGLLCCVCTAATRCALLQINQLAMWLETSKMHSSLTGNVLGGGLLGDLVQRMAAAEASVSSGSQVRVADVAHSLLVYMFE
jgi:hypothetical protein